MASYLPVYLSASLGFERAAKLCVADNNDAAMETSQQLLSQASAASYNSDTSSA